MEEVNKIKGKEQGKEKTGKKDCSEKERRIGMKRKIRIGMRKVVRGGQRWMAIVSEVKRV